MNWLNRFEEKRSRPNPAIAVALAEPHKPITAKHLTDERGKGRVGGTSEFWFFSHSGALARNFQMNVLHSKVNGSAHIS
jgi:hypothetical protein